MLILQRRNLFIITCLGLVFILSSCTVAENEIEPQADTTVSTVDRNESSDTAIENNETLAHISAIDWPMENCSLEIKVETPQQSYNNEIQISEPEIVYTYDSGFYLEEWLPSDQEVLIRRPDETGHFLESIDVTTGETTVHTITQSSQQVMWHAKTNSIVYTDVHSQAGQFELKIANNKSSIIPQYLSSKEFDINPINQTLVVGNQSEDSVVILDLGTGDFQENHSAFNHTFYAFDEDQVRIVRWSSDGAFLAVYTQNNYLYLFDTAHQKICRYDFQSIYDSKLISPYLFQFTRGVQWQPTGDKLLLPLSFGSGGPGNLSDEIILSILDINDGILTIVKSTDAQTREWGNYISGALWSPNGTYIVFIGDFPRIKSSWKLHIYDLEANHIIASSTDATGVSHFFHSLALSNDGTKLAQLCKERGGIITHICLRDIAWDNN